MFEPFMPELEEEQEKPLDPKLEHIRKRMLRLLGISIGILFAGLVAVFSAIIYKINSDDDYTAASSPGSVIPGEDRAFRSFDYVEKLNLAAPEGGTLHSSDLDGAVLLVTWQLDNGGYQLWLVDLQSGNILSKVTVE